MSDDQTVRIGPDGPPPRQERSRTVVTTVVALVLAGLVLLLFALRSGQDVDEDAAPLVSESAQPPTEAPPTEGDDAPSETTAATEPQPSETTGPDESETPPSTNDVTAFVDAYEAEHGAPVTTRILDVDADGLNEVVVARVGDNAIQVDVAAWDGTQYAVVFTDTGGAAERLDDLAVREANQDGSLEIITFQSVGEEGHSVTLWGAVPGPDGIRFERQEAVGGCWDGSNTYGIVGATVEGGQITATCDGSPLPPELWPSDIYVWGAEGWTYDRTEEPE